MSDEDKKHSRLREYVRQIKSADDESAHLLALELFEKAWCEGMRSAGNQAQTLAHSLHSLPKFVDDEPSPAVDPSLTEPRSI